MVLEPIPQNIVYIFFFKKKHIADLLVAMHWNDAATPCMHETQ